MATQVIERDRNVRSARRPAENSTPLQEYWQECSSFEESNHPFEDDDEAAKTPDEGEAEEEWLREAGFENLVDSPELNDDHTFDEILFTLTSRQRAVVQKRLQTFQMSKKKKKHNKNRQRADVREVFNCQNSLESLPSVEPVHDKRLPVSSTIEVTTTNSTSNNVPSANHIDQRQVYKGSSNGGDYGAVVHDDLPKFTRSSSSSVLPLFLRSGHSGGFTLNDHHTKGIDTESPTSVEVLRYESRSSTVQEPFSLIDEIKTPFNHEIREISFQGISSRLDPTDDLTGGPTDASWKAHIPVADLSEEDRTSVRSLAVIEVAALLDSHNIVPSRSRKRQRKKGKENIVLGATLTALLELDRRRCPGLKLPLIYQWILHHLHENGLKEEGLMRLAGSVQKVEVLKAECEKCYILSPSQVENSIRQSSVHDVSILLKQLVRHLPEPLLTNCHMDTFLQVPNIPSMPDQIAALNLLVLALPDVHRELLEELLYFLGRVVEHEDYNRMSLSNVAMIMAPNLFPPPRLKKSHHKSNDLAAEVTIAALSSKVTQLLIKYGHLLGTVPKQLLAQARLQGQRSSKKHTKRPGGRKTKTEKLKVEKESLIPSSYRSSAVIRVHVVSPSRNGNASSMVPVTVNDRTTAGEVVERVAKILDQFPDSTALGYPEQQESKVLLLHRTRTSSEPLPMRQKCLLGSKKPTDSLKDHFLYHIGENSSERMLDHHTGILEVTNGSRSSLHPGSSLSSTWEVRCHH